MLASGERACQFREDGVRLPLFHLNPAPGMPTPDLPLQTLVLAQASGGQSPTSMLLIWGLLIAGMWFLIIAPQMKRQKQHRKMLESLKAGDDIVTNGGIHGKIVEVRADRFIVKISDNTRIGLAKSFVQEKVSGDESESDKTDGADKK